MNSRKVFVFVLVAAAFLLQACGPSLEATLATANAQTQQVSQLETAAALAVGGGGGQIQPTITETPGPGLAFVSVSQNTNCRSGPNASYSVLTSINAGQQVEVLKVFSNEYVLIQNPNATGDCWLFLQYADNIDFTAFNLEVATQPPTPELANNPISTQNQEDAQGDEVEDGDEAGEGVDEEEAEELHITVQITQGPTCGSNCSEIRANFKASEPVEISYWLEFSGGNHTSKTTTILPEGNSSIRFLFFRGFGDWVRLYIGSPQQISSNKLEPVFSADK